jgi:hypothetical protein
MEARRVRVSAAASSFSATRSGTEAEASAPRSALDLPSVVICGLLGFIGLADISKLGSSGHEESLLTPDERFDEVCTVSSTSWGSDVSCAACWPIKPAAKTVDPVRGESSFSREVLDLSTQLCSMRGNQDN